MRLPKPKSVKVKDIKPYDNNPRVIDEKSLEAVRFSIENYGYVQPIIVDPDMVIIAGHTRHQALQELGIDTTDVYIADLPEAKARALRLADNRTGELSSWDKSSLTMELRELEDAILQAYFPDMDLELGQLKTAMRTVSEDQLEAAEDEVLTLPHRQVQPTIEIQCPSCMGMFEVKAATLDVSPEDLTLLIEQD